MSVLPEERIVAYIRRCLELSQAILPMLQAKGTKSADSEKLAAYRQLVGDLSSEREKDSYLSDESWNWIWKDKKSYNHLQLYGRLAWINLQLLDLL